MLQKTEMSEASTNAEAKTTSFYTSRAREMFRQQKKGESPSKDKQQGQLSTGHLPNDLIFLEPEVINNLAWPELFLFENDLRASIKDNFYEVSGMRGGSKFLPRRAQPTAELVYFWGEKPRKLINLFSMERFMVRTSEEEQLWSHINLTKYQQDNGNVQSSDFYLHCENKQSKNSQEHELWDFRAFQTIQNCRKGVLIMRVLHRSGQDSALYRVMLIDLTQRKKTEANQSQRTPLRVLTTIDLYCEMNFGRESEKFIKTIKSEFGDIILIITSKEIYELQVEEVGEGYKLALKPYKISKTITGTKDNYLKSEGLIKDGKVKERMSAKTQEIEDAQFVSNGLKIMILTNYEQVIFIQAHNFLFSQAIHEVLATSQLGEKYKLDTFRFTHLHSINGSLAIQFVSANGQNLLYSTPSEQTSDKQEKVTQGFLLLKPQNNYLAFGKLISLPFQSKDVLHRSVHESHGGDQILIQYIQRRNPQSLKVIKCRTLMAELNAIVRVDSIQYSYPKVVDFTPPLLAHFHPSEVEKRYTHCDMPYSSRVFYFLNEKELTCYKLFNELDAQKISKQMRKLFTHNFFQKPIKIAVSPLTLHFAIVFKQFVKFFHFNYSTIKNYFTLKLKHVVDVEYVNRGAQVLVTCIDGLVYLLDAYRFQEEKILEFYGEPAEVKMIDEKHLLVRSNKNVLALYQRGWDEDENGKEFSKIYEIRVEDGDHYVANLEQILVFKKSGQMEVYSHTPMEVPADWPQAERECYLNLQNAHRHLANRIKCNSFLLDEVPTKILLNEQLGFLFVSTSRGNIKQYLWPLQSPSNPNPPSVFTQQVCSSRIISIILDAKYTYLYSISQNGTISQLQMKQYISAQPMPYVYIFSEKTRKAEQQKREFTDRNYFIDNYAPTEGVLMQAAHQNLEELEFFIDKLKDDLEEMTKNLLFNGRQRETEIKRTTKGSEQQFKKTLKEDEGKYSSQLEQLRTMIELNERQIETEKTKEVEQYQKKLLQLYRQSDRLKKILRTQDEKLTQEKKTFRKQFQYVLEKYNNQKDEQLAKLQSQYKLIEQRRRLSQKQNEILDKEQQVQMQLYKVKIHEQQESELRGEDEYKQKLLGQNTKKEKAIMNLKNRGNYFQNLIQQTKVQIDELKKDHQEYDKKKEYLREELKDKQDIIQKIEKELVLYLRNTEDMKTIKNNHEFELNEYEKEVNPIQEDYRRIQDNVKHMNMEIMKEYNHKVEKGDDIKAKNDHIAELKQQKKRLLIKKLEEEGKFLRLTQKLTHLATHTFDIDLKYELKTLLDSNDRETHLLKQDEEKERMKKDGEKLLRYKNMVRKQIEEQEKRQQHIIKNQHEFYKYHIENTTLVREFNDLKKTQKILCDQYNKLAEKLSILKLERINTPLKRVPSINLRKVQEKKQTPFQKYQQETSTNVRKNQDTTDTKLSRNSQSLSFLKGLMKQVNQTDSKYQKMQVMRQRVRTFVNPELRSKPEDIKKLLFGRTRGTSEMLKLK